MLCVGFASLKVLNKRKVFMKVGGVCVSLYTIHNNNDFYKLYSMHNILQLKRIS